MSIDRHTAPHETADPAAATRPARDRRLVTRLAGVAAVTALAIGLTGCGAAPWQLAETVEPETTPSATAAPAPVIRTIQNDLAAGSAHRDLAAGAINMSVDYWSELAMSEWSAGANKPISFSLSGSLVDDAGQKFYLSRVAMAVAVTGPDGTLESPAQVVDQASVTPGYLVKSPYSYSQTFVMPPVDARATSVTVTFNYEMLLQSTPTSSDYAKQTASDTLTIAIAQPEVEAESDAAGSTASGSTGTD
jgi:hypothetical protein